MDSRRASVYSSKWSITHIKSTRLSPAGSVKCVCSSTARMYVVTVCVILICRSSILRRGRASIQREHTLSTLLLGFPFDARLLPAVLHARILCAVRLISICMHSGAVRLTRTGDALWWFACGNYALAAIGCIHILRRAVRSGPVRAGDAAKYSTWTITSLIKGPALLFPCSISEKQS